LPDRTNLVDAGMNLAEFIAYHAPALAIEEVKHGLILNAFALASGDPPIELPYWTLGEPGQCAIMTPPHSIVLGALDEGQCQALAESTAQTSYPGVIGPELTARWFTERALRLGPRFHEPVKQRIHSLTGNPRYPGTPGHARSVTAQDIKLFTEWMMQFHLEATPFDPTPLRSNVERAANRGRFLFWIDGGHPVSMAGIVRPLKDSAAISGVYTPPTLRGRGYAGSVTAAAVECIQASGRKIAYLYTDLDNPFSNRCYAKIGFRPVCDALHFHRQI
jgi:predicted GNAT family acetyltransferase